MSMSCLPGHASPSVNGRLCVNKFTRSGHAQLPSNAIMVTSTITTVLFSTFVFGLLTKPLFRLLIPARHLSRERSALSDPPSPRSFLEALIPNGSEAGPCEHTPPDESPAAPGEPDTVGPPLLAQVRRRLHAVFGGRGFVPFVPCSPTDSSVPLLPGNES